MRNSNRVKHLLQILAKFQLIHITAKCSYDNCSASGRVDNKELHGLKDIEAFGVANQFHEANAHKCQACDVAETLMYQT